MNEPLTLTNVPPNAFIGFTASDYHARQSLLDSANATIAGQQATLLENERVYAEVVRQNAGLLDTNRKQSEMLKAAAQNEARLKSLFDRLYALFPASDGDLEAAVQELIANNATLKQRIAELEGNPAPVELPPVETAPVAFAPVITKTELHDVAGFCITLGLEAPSSAIDAAARDLMAIGKRMGFNNVRFFRNKDEVALDVGRSPDDPRHLYAFAHRNGFAVTADTVDRAALDFEDNELAAYIGGLERLGAVLLVFNDANQYRGKKKDGTPYPPTTLEAMVSRVRDVTDLPIMASLTAGATITDYKPLFDFVEAQTFGSTGNLDMFLDRGFDAYCLPAESKNSLDYFSKAHDIILNDNPAAFWYYTALDKRTDWRDMTDKTALIEKTVKAWLEARRVKA